MEQEVACATLMWEKVGSVWRWHRIKTYGWKNRRKELMSAIN
jgi:hypothetical protein